MRSSNVSELLDAAFETRLGLISTLRDFKLGLFQSCYITGSTWFMLKSKTTAHPVTG